jgi:hypothetical protein
MAAVDEKDLAEAGGIGGEEKRAEGGVDAGVGNHLEETILTTGNTGKHRANHFRNLICQADRIG